MKALYHRHDISDNVWALEERLAAIERHVQKRVRQLLDLIPVREKAKKRPGQER